MCVCVCVCVCVCACVYTCTRAYMHTCVCVCVFVHTQIYYGVQEYNIMYLTGGVWGHDPYGKFELLGYIRLHLRPF